ncbi:hypothetical protein RclHR1_05050003 [Rhizophagus clarus]|uniref:F-box domain-containing protein n=1 Tax=Rhizophagus clarus TaxID=94130 RepID=A0A2Z6RK70_9GLOM|nr:hypothetical protein RclHR1_05050003 [Rhizophagus clarus]GES80971.1 hypothetical protein GLOIN_2v1780770 [Rhizophagus clarus]
MSKLNRDVLYSIFEKLKDDKKALYSCLTVNRTWCKIIIPIFWKDPWKQLYTREAMKLSSLFDVIISHLSDESRKNISGKFLKNYKKPLFDYISFCKNLNLSELKRIMNVAIDSNLQDDDDDYLFYKGEIYKLFINNKTKFTQLYLPREFSDQIHLIPGAKECFSEIEFLNFYGDVNGEILIGLSEICKSIKRLEFFVTINANSGIIKLIDAQKRLKEVYIDFVNDNESIHKSLENSLIRHEKNIEYFKLKNRSMTNILSYFKNLKILEMVDIGQITSWNQLTVVSLPILQILHARNVPINVITSLIEKTNGHLNEIRIDFVGHDIINNKRLIQAIYQNCPNLNYLELLIMNSNISEFEKLLIKCKYLDGLFIITYNINWVDLFKILTRSSPSSLYKFKFYFSMAPNSESLRFFFDNWKGRHPMLLHTVPATICDSDYIDINMINEYKTKGIIKIYDEDISGDTYEDFEWIRKKIQKN